MLKMIIIEYILIYKKSARYNVGNRVRISKFKNIFSKGYTPNWSREIFIINKYHIRIRIRIILKI